MTLRRISLRVLLAWLLIGWIGIAQAATIYRWVDERGRVHYGDQRGAGVSAIEIRPGGGEARPVEQAEAVQPLTQECERRKSQLEAYKSAASVVETDALGQSHEYDPAQRTQLMQLAERRVLSACGRPGV
ncbi:MAG: hypothetical protein JWQ90_4601 [Hydrocarboniphaga sp.]|uniref:DUF4124 domain-containing protein n=1 Tax=Hydrocarboniphaga sp. TaxID=2033016 RepID=UPI0026394E63|nr:DUF4124 domain-containing protein [Hydrocarboniphaga sp.]MDB5972151.1 hypothetical protein [Hydrocarboniphaga sp.]